MADSSFKKERKEPVEKPPKGNVVVNGLFLKKDVDEVNDGSIFIDRRYQRSTKKLLVEDLHITGERKLTKMFGDYVYKVYNTGSASFWPFYVSKEEAKRLLTLKVGQGLLSIRKGPKAHCSSSPDA